MKSKKQMTTGETPNRQTGSEINKLLSSLNKQFKELEVGDIYPDIKTTSKLKVHYSNLYTNKSLLDGEGLFTSTDIRKGEIIGVYGGRASRLINDYSSQPFGVLDSDVSIDGTPDPSIRSTIIGYANAWIWEHIDGVNAEFHGGGGNILIATRDIDAFTEIYTAYGDYYGKRWDRYKLKLARRASALVRDVADLLEISKFDEDIKDLQLSVDQWVLRDGNLDLYRHSGVGKLILNAIDGNIRIDSMLHRVQPKCLEEDSFEEWLERVLRCSVIYEQIAFGGGIIRDTTLMQR